VKLITQLHLSLRSKNEWNYISTPPYTFTAWCSVKKAQTTFYYTFPTYSLRSILILSSYLVSHFITSSRFTVRVISFSPNTIAGGLQLIGHPCLFIQYIRSKASYAEAASSIENPRTSNVVAKGTHITWTYDQFI
jgi:hypothetical protein